MNRNVICAIFLAVALLVTPAAATTLTPQVLTAQVFMAKGSLSAPGGPYLVSLRLKLAPKYHMNGPDVGKTGLIPTEILFKGPAGITVDKIKFPPTHAVEVEFSKKPIQVYSGEVLVTASLDVAASVKPGKYKINAYVRYQACDTKLCHMPATMEIPFTVTVSAKKK